MKESKSCGFGAEEILELEHSQSELGLESGFVQGEKSKWNKSQIQVSGADRDLAGYGQQQSGKLPSGWNWIPWMFLGLLLD